MQQKTLFPSSFTQYWWKQNSLTFISGTLFEMFLSGYFSYVQDLMHSYSGPKPWLTIPRAQRPCGLFFCFMHTDGRWGCFECPSASLRHWRHCHRLMLGQNRSCWEEDCWSANSRFGSVMAHICLSLDNPTCLWTRLTLCMGKQALPRMCLQNDTLQRYFHPAFGYGALGGRGKGQTLQMR